MSVEKAGTLSSTENGAFFNRNFYDRLSASSNLDTASINSDLFVPKPESFNAPTVASGPRIDSKVVAAADIAYKRAANAPTKKCARRVREAFGQAGIKINQVGKAMNYGQSLIDAQFISVATYNKNTSSGDYPNGYVPQNGDVAVIQPCPGSKKKRGHMQIYNAKAGKWVSDFHQKRPFWPGYGYSVQKPSYVIYRYSTENTLLASK